MGSAIFETEHCGRCGGTGHYSYNQVDGTVCYGCGGSGKKLTKRGAAAKKFADEMLTVTIAEVGSRRAKIRTAFFKATFSGVAVRAKSGVRVRGSEVTMYEPLVNGEPCGASFSGSQIVTLIPTEEEVAEISAYQDSLTKSGTVRKSRVRGSRGAEYDSCGEPILIDYDDKF